MKQVKNKVFQKLNAKDFHSVIAYAAAMVLTGVPVAVCESVVDEVYCSLKKSVEKMLML